MKKIYKVILTVLFPEFVAGYYGIKKAYQIVRKILDNRKVEVLH